MCRCEKQLVEDEIKKETKLLKEGLLFFKPYTEASLQNIPKNDPSPRMYELISKLAPLLVCITNKFLHLIFLSLIIVKNDRFILFSFFLFLEFRRHNYMGFSM